MQLSTDGLIMSCKRNPARPNVLGRWSENHKRCAYKCLQAIENLSQKGRVSFLSISAKSEGNSGGRNGLKYQYQPFGVYSYPCRDKYCAACSESLPTLQCFVDIVA